MRRTGLVIIALLMSGVLVCAQGFIPVSVQNARQKELQDLAAKLLASKDTQERVDLRNKIVEKDAITEKDVTPAGGPKVLGTGFSVPAFVGLYRAAKTSNDLSARLHAVIGLAMVDSPASEDPLLEMLDDPAEAIQYRAIQAIDQKGMQRAGKDVLVKLRSPDPEVVAAAARCLADIGYGASGESTGPMIELMVQKYEKLVATPVGDPVREECNRLIEVLGRSCGQLIGQVTWSPGASVEDLKAEIAKFTRWWNGRHLEALKDPRYTARRDALVNLRPTADKSIFFPILEAVVKDFTRLQDANTPLADKQRSKQFIVDASVLLNQISATDTLLRPTSTVDDIASVIKAWQTWWKDQMKGVTP